MIYWLYFFGIMLLSSMISCGVVIIYIKVLSVLKKRYGNQIRDWMQRSSLKKLFPI